MKKKYAIFLFVSVIILSTVVFASAIRKFEANEVSFEIIIDGKECQFRQPIVTIGDRAYLPLRELCDFIDYSVNWDENGVITMIDEQVTISDGDIFTSKEGTLRNGRKYVFNSIDKQKISIKNYIEQNDLFESKIYDMKIKDKEIETITETVQELFGLDNSNVENAGIKIYYDMDLNAFMFMTDYYGVPQPGGWNVIVVSLEDGLTTMYSSRTA